MLRNIFLFLALVSIGATATADPLKVVATSTSMGALVKEVAGDSAKLTVLAPPDRDLHYLQAKPSMIRALRSTDLLVSVGAELEIGWLPVAISSSANPQINPGQVGYFEAATHVPLLDKGVAADRSMGDVHPAGNPHFTLDPLRMAAIAKALATRLSKLNPENSDSYQRNALAFADKAKSRSEQWKTYAANAPGVLLYHRDAVYLTNHLNIPLLNVIEPIAGVPASAKHLKQLVSDLSGKQGVIVTTSYQPAKVSDALAKQLQWPVTRLPLDPPLESDGDELLNHIELWTKALSAKAE